MAFLNSAGSVMLEAHTHSGVDLIIEPLLAEVPLVYFTRNLA